MVTPRIINIAVLMMLIFYAFAIIGMECFHGKVFQHCCKLVVLLRIRVYIQYNDVSLYVSRLKDATSAYMQSILIKDANVCAVIYVPTM